MNQAVLRVVNIHTPTLSKISYRHRFALSLTPPPPRARRLLSFPLTPPISPKRSVVLTSYGCRDPWAQVRGGTPQCWLDVLVSLQLRYLDSS